MPRFKEWLRRNANIVLIVLVPLLASLLPIFIPGNEAKCGFVLIVIAVYWTTECLPIGITSLIPIVAFPLLGIMPSKKVTALYFQDITFLLFGGLVMSSAVELSGLHERISLRALILFGSNPIWILFGLMLIIAFMSLWITNSASCAMMLPITNSIITQFVLNDEAFRKEPKKHILKVDFENNSLEEMNIELEDNVNVDEKERCRIIYARSKSARQLATCFLLSCTYASSIGGFGSLVGTGSNIYFKGYFDQNYPQYNLGFLNFGLFAFPIALLLLLATWAFLCIRFLPKRFFMCFSRDMSQTANIKMIIRDRYNSLGSIKFEEICIGAIFLLLIVLFITRDLAGLGGWQNLFPKGHVSDTTSAIIAVLLLFVCPRKNIFKGEKYEHLLDWKKVQQILPWSVVLLVGGGLALADGFNKSGLSRIVGDLLQRTFIHNPQLALLIICLLGSFGTEFTCNLSMSTILIPLVDSLARSSNISSIYFLLPLVLSINLAFMLPVATPTNPIILANENVKMRDMMSTGIVIKLFGILIVFLATVGWLGSIFNLDPIIIAKTVNNNKNITSSFSNSSIKSF